MPADSIKSYLIPYSRDENVQRLKFSASARNDTYTIGTNDSTVHVGMPDIAWDKLVFNLEKRQMWTHGTLFDCSLDAEAIKEIIGQQSDKYDVVLLEPEEFAELDLDNTREKVLYCELGEVVDTTRWHFGDRFPIRLS